MKTQSFRLENVGLINRNKKLSFKFNGKFYYGYEGDTLASALIANGVHLVGRSFKYHRPRGFFGAGVDEPCGECPRCDERGWGCGHPYAIENI